MKKHQVFQGDSGSGLLCGGKLAGVFFGVEEKNCSGISAHISVFHYIDWVEKTVNCGMIAECSKYLMVSNVGSKNQPYIIFALILMFVSFFIYVYF